MLFNSRLSLLSLLILELKKYVVGTTPFFVFKKKERENVSLFTWYFRDEDMFMINVTSLVLLT
jgi:hypothetical protein